ncbi:InlB B-repeat-containing protein [Peptoniphilus grossensis]|uniref:InlB B-repeat-containing protein n=1 Tax=Peptoniphilus grossensis TaxID=1465756 RepID=UPI0002FD1322|nr:S-layer homology domain-containing protein [Peptoniphilus grossensis]
MTKEMSKRITSLFLALIMILQILIPQNIFAEEEKKLPQDKYVKVGMIDGKSYDAKIMNELNRIAAKNRKQGPINIGTSLFSSGPYFGDNNEPKDADKPKYFGNVSAKLDLKGLDGNDFQWNEIFGVDENGNPNPAQIIFRQMDEESSTDTGLYYMLQITKGGKYTWSDGAGNPTKLPLFSKSLKPYKYEVRIDERVSDKVKLLTEVIFGTEGSSPTFSPENADGEIIANITLGLTYQQIASTKFKSEWHTGVVEADRPDMKANFAFDDEGDGVSPVSVELPRNDKDTKIIRDWYNEFDPDLVISYYLEKTPDVKIDETTTGLTFDTANKTVKSVDHKFKYDFKYDVINGGKLTMTEVIPVTFDANGGKFANYEAPDTDTKIVKEVDYDGTLTDKAENPTKDRETFKGWSETKGGKTPVTDEVFKNIKEAKTFYAIWDNNDIVAEELEVKESFKDGTGYVNDFIPTFDTLKKQVKIKNGNGDPQALANDDTFAIVDGTNEYKTDAEAKDYLYGKLQEKDDGNKPSRQETVTAKVTHANGTSQTVEIPIKVIKNIYEAKTLTDKPFYVPDRYVKVTLDPTTTAKDPQKTYYYVNPDAKVVIPGSDPTATDGYVFTKWLIDGTDTEYKFADRHQFTEASTITAQYDKEGKGIIKIAYVDENGNEISADYHKDGVDYPSKKEGKLNSEARDEEFPKPGPDFKGYIFSSRDSIKGKHYNDPSDPDNLDTVKYSYFKKVTTDTPKNPNVYFPVIFDANTGKFEAAPKDKKIVYVYFNGNDATVEKVTFKEVKDEFEKAYSNPTKDGFDFKEWQDKADKGSAVGDDYEIQFKGWDSQTYEPTGDTFYAHYGKASALISYLDLDGKEIDAKFKFISTEDGKDVDGEGNKLTLDKKYPTEKEGTLDEKIASDVFTAKTAPTLIGYKFNRIELNPKDGKYAMDNKATIKIYYEKLPDVIPSTGNDKPDGYVTVTFEPRTNGTLDGETKYYVNPKADPVKTMADITQPTIKANQGFKVADTKWKDANDAALDTATQITKDLTYTAQYTGLDDIIPDTTPDDDTDKPDGYVTVKFLPGDHGTLGGTTKYYVNPKADSVKTMNDITEPTVTANTGYEVADPKWKDASDVALDKTTQIKTDLTYTAQYKFTKDVVPQGPGEDKPVVPDNYVKVTFKEGDHGLISASQTTIYWVNPDKEVTLTAPAVTANADYKHTAWTYSVNSQNKTTSGADATTSVKDTFAVDTDITAQYKKKVVPGPDQPNVPGTTNPDNEYVKVEFVAKDHGKIKDGETKEYWVLKDETVELKTPAVEAKTNYAFKEWKEPVQTSYSKDTTHNAVFAYTGENVVPQKPGEEKPDVPADFVKVVFDKGANGEFAADATTTYWVNPKVKVTVTAPAVTANDDYKHVAWTYGTKEVNTLESVTDTFTAEETTITAKYLKKVLEEKPTTDTDAYVEVKFNAESNGKLPEDKTVKSYWVLKDTPVKFDVPTVTANPGWKFIKYDPAVKTSYSQDTEHKAQYKKIIETKDPKDKDYVKVTFDPAAQGSIKTGSAEVWVLKDVTIDKTKITPEIEVKDTNYAFKEWTPAVKDKYTEDTKHVASYTYNGKDVVPQKPGEDKPNVPDNFVKVTFVAGDHGSIANTETYIFWVNPEKEVTLNAPKLTANVDYKHMAWTYKLTPSATVDKEVKTLESVTDKFTEKETTITAKYLKKVLTEDPKDTTNYVKVDFKADVDTQDPARGTLTGTTTYWVLKNTDVTVPAPKVTPNSGYTFTEWAPPVKTNYDVDTTHTAQYNEKDKVLTEDPKNTDYIKVTFNANGGKIGMEDAKDVWVLKDIATFADAKAKIATPIKEKATFKEWQDKASEGTAVEGTKVLSTANETFYAAYTDYDKIIEDPTTNTPEDGYVRLTFDATDAGRIGTADGEQKKVIDVLKGTPYTDTDLKAKLDEIKAVPVKDEDGNAVADKEKTFDKWTPAVPTTGYVKTETFTASYKKFIPKQEKIDITATKAWQDAEGNTPNFTTPEVKFELWRKAGQAGTEEIVKEATALENNSVTFSKVDKYDANGVEYIYFVKEVFTNPAEKENWTVSGEGTLNLTNKLKGDSTDPGTDKVGKLTITKKLENEPVALKAFSMMRAPAPAASEPLKFKFKVTGPYGYEETFELAANESKTLDKLAYGDYKVEETDTKGYKAEYSKTKETLTKENPNGSITVTNKNKIPGENETNDNIIDVTVTKVWVGGEKPATEIQLWRTGYGLNGKVFQEKVGSFTTTAKGDDTQTHKFEKLAKQDPSGKVFTYYAVEENVPANYTASYSEDNLTVTNTYNAPAKKYTVTYKAGSSTATGTMAADTDARGTYTVKANGFTNDGYTFKGWKVGDTTQIVQPGATITVTANVTLTAIWEKTTTPPTPDPDKPNPDKPNPWDPKPWNPNYPDLPYIPRYPEIRYETIVQEKIVKVPVPIADNAYIKEVRYMQGFMGDFRPKDGLTRAEAAQILANALVEDGYKYNANFKLPYKDIGEAWYTRAVKIVTEAKVFAGYDDGNFKPQDKITRNEWIATLKRFQELGDVSGNHMKLKDGHWAMAEIEAAYKEGWLKIYTDGLATYEGDKFIPREEVAAVSNKAFNRVLDKTYIINNDKNLITYKDVKKDMWSYEDILCASNTFLYKKDLYRAHWIKEDNNQFNINTDGFEIVKAKFQRNPR